MAIYTLDSKKCNKFTFLYFKGYFMNNVNSGMDFTGEFEWMNDHWLFTGDNTTNIITV